MESIKATPEFSSDIPSIVSEASPAPISLTQLASEPLTIERSSVPDTVSIRGESAIPDRNITAAVQAIDIQSQLTNIQSQLSELTTSSTPIVPLSAKTPTGFANKSALQRHVNEHEAMENRLEYKISEQQSYQSIIEDRLMVGSTSQGSKNNQANVII